MIKKYMLLLIKRFHLYYYGILFAKAFILTTKTLPIKWQYKYKRKSLKLHPLIRR